MNQGTSLKKKTTRFLKRSFAMATAFCLLVFIVMGFLIFQDTITTTNRISRTYMKEINLQIHQKFDALMRLRVVQLKGIAEQVPADGYASYEELLDELCEKAMVRELASLGLYSAERGYESVLGGALSLGGIGENSWCSDGEHLMLLGYTQQGEKQFVLGLEAAYPMSDGSQADFLLAGVPVEYLNEAMYLSVTGSIINAHIIDSNGDYVIKNLSANHADNMYERIRTEFAPLDGKSLEDYEAGLRKAIQENQDYELRYMLDGEIRRMYCTKLSEHFDCYIISVMPEHYVFEMVDDMYLRRFLTLLVAVLLVMGMFMFIFSRYYRMTLRQVEELEKARREADEANRAKGRFLSNISHDIRTPLNAIIGMTDMAMKNENNPEKTTEQLRKLQVSGQHLLALINDVLDMSSVENGKLTLEIQPFMLSEFCSDTVSIVQPLMRSKNQQFDVQVDKLISDAVFGDRVKLSQVLMNLLSNATKYTPDGGKVTLHIYQEPSMGGQGFVATHFVVSDNGIGMSKEFMGRMFQPFEREQTGMRHKVLGTGLGLSITKAVLDMMSGTIAVQSKLGQGSSFHVSIDMKRADVPATDGDEAAGEAGLAGKRLLVAEDIDINWEITQDMLSELGLTLERAENGRACVDMFAASRPGYYDAILMDIHMPELDGFGATKCIRGMDRADRNLPVIAMTADVFEEDIRDCYAHGMSAYISKPVNIAECEKVLMKYLK